MSVNWKRLLNFSLVSVIVLGAGIGLARLGLGKLISDTDLQLETLNQLELSPRVPAKVYEEVPKKLLRSDPRQQRLSHILERGTLRVGYKKDSLPFAFMNDRGELVGLDVQLYHELAMELGITLEFIPWTYDTLYKQLDRGDFELTAGGLIVSTRRLTRMTFSQPYMDITMALIVKDYQRKEITTWQAIEETPGFVIAVGSSQIANRVQEYLPQTEVVILDSFSQFFNGESKADALLMSAEAGSAWTILYPQYSVAIPEPHFTRPIAIAMAWGDQEFLDFVDAWLSVKKSSGEIDRLYNKWILGKDQKQKKPRWSIMRNVLHWGDEAPPG